MDNSVNLLKNRNILATIRFSDGLVAGFHSYDKNIVITSPNSNIIYEPPLGSTRSVVRREDGFYAEDDYVHWPQPWNRKFSHLCVIPVNPRDDAASRYTTDAIMWYPISEADVELERGGIYKTYPSTPATLSDRIFEDLEASVQRLRTRLVSFRNTFASKHAILSLVDIYLSIIDVCTLRLDISRPIRDIRRGVAEIQRAWLSCAALIDYMEIYNPRMKEPGYPAQIADRVLGAFTSDPDEARALFNAGIPVYFTRPAQEVGSANILAVITPLVAGGKICQRDANPPYQMIYMGPAGSDTKFDTILRHAQLCFAEKSIFETGVHYDGQYRSSWQLGMSLSHPESANALDSSAGPSRAVGISRQHRRTPFSRDSKTEKSTTHPETLWYPLPESLSAPYVVSLWSNEVTSIDTKHPSRRHKGASPTRFFLVPPPHLFFKPDGALRGEHLLQWRHFRPAWIRRCLAESQSLNPLPTPTWKELLLFGMHRRAWDESIKPTSKVEKCRQDAWNTLKSTLDKFGENESQPYIAPQDTLPDSATVKDLVWQITETNFRFELRCLDADHDDSRPKAERFSSFNEYQIAAAEHANHRTRLINNIFSRPALVDLNSRDANTGLAGKTTKERLEHTHALWVLMSSWRLKKAPGWYIADAGLASCSTETSRWEKNVVRYYLQSAFNSFGFIPSLPHRL